MKIEVGKGVFVVFIWAALIYIGMAAFEYQKYAHIIISLGEVNWEFWLN
jgi:hypothetical protein